MVLPFVPDSVPLPGDATYRRATRTVDEVLLPVVREQRRRGGDEPDILTMLSQARNETGARLPDEQVRDDLIALFAAGTESTAVALTWLWLVLDGQPAVADRLRTEVAEVVGAGPVRRGHLPALRYTRMVLQEVLRLYPPGWLIPRTAVAADDLAGVPIRPGDTVLVSPYLTHRLPGYLDDPARFDPGDPLPVVALPNRYVLLYFLDRLHRRFPSLRATTGICPKFKGQLGFRRCSICC